jgi:hypothetical protein
VAIRQGENTAFKKLSSLEKRGGPVWRKVASDKDRQTLAPFREGCGGACEPDSEQRAQTKDVWRDPSQQRCGGVGSRRQSCGVRYSGLLGL